MDRKSVEADIENAKAEKYSMPVSGLVAVGKQSP